MAGIETYLEQIENAIYGKDVRQAIHDGIETCYLEGKAGTTDLEARRRIDEANERIDSFTNLEEGSTTGDAELIDGRTVGGVTYANIGGAVRAVGDAVDAVSPSPELTWILKRNVDGNGNISTNNYMALTDAIPCSVGDRFVRVTQAAVNNKSLIGYFSEFNGTTFIRRSTFNTVGQAVVISDPNTTNVRIAFGRASSSGVEITQSDVDTYFKVNIYRKSVAQEEYKLNAFVNRGRFQDTGYSSLSECVDQGYYTFGSNDSISDLPTGWNGGGLLEVFNNRDRAIWQRITGLTASYIRYSTSGTWLSEEEKQYIKAEYDGTAGENNSIEQLNITIPRNKGVGFTRFNMGHCVDNDSNANVWRIIFAYANTRQITMTGEWECALHLADRDDFSGGIVHGDEIDQTVVAFADGTLIDISDINGYYNELKIVRSSALYDPADHTTRIAEHGVEYIYNTKGLTIKQSVKWLVDASLTNCFLAMLPIIKAYSTQRFDDTSFAIVNNNQSNYSVLIPQAKEVTEYNSGYDTFMTMGISEYPTGMEGGDRARVTDNGGLNYNKVYFQVCSSGTVEAGTLWKAESYYRTK